MNSDIDTIAAASTPMGYGGIAIVRLSGMGAFEIADKIVDIDVFKQPSHTIRHCHAKSGGEAIDEALISKMQAPRTYTREDVVEINCHGGYIAAEKVLEAALTCGARLAEPGEFTKRAFLNGRIDLSQAEAVSDVIMANSEISHKLAYRQLSGELRETLEGLKGDALKIAARIEASIEYPEYEETGLSESDALSAFKALEGKTESLLEGFNRSKAYREAYQAVICGKPNVGKSMLLNRLVKKEKAIVTEIRGTTTDVIDEIVSLNGFNVKFSDTAGIRGALGRIEQIGVGRSLKALKECDLRIFVVDGSKPLDEEDLKVWNMIEGEEALYILNKSDLGVNEETRQFFEGKGAIEASAHDGLNIEGVLEAVSKKASSGNISGLGFLANMRQAKALEEALKAVKSAILTISGGSGADLATVDIRDFLSEIGKITGETATEDIIDEVFREFCLGK